MSSDWSRGRLGARPLLDPERRRPRRLDTQASSPAPGFSSLNLGARDGVLYVPASFHANKPTALMLLLHGAGGAGARTARMMQPYADREGFLLIAPDSAGQTWDVIERDIGPDVERIDRVLGNVFAQFDVDEKHIAIAGFSDGASYALTLGIANGDLFTHAIAFSPGFFAFLGQHGRPRMFLSHGRADNVLPIQQCSRRIVPQLRGAGYDIDYREFDGGHTVPADIARDAVAWFVA